MRTIKTLITDMIPPDLEIELADNLHYANSNINFEPVSYGNLAGKGWVLVVAHYNEYEYEVVHDSEGAQVLICKKKK